MEYCSLRLIAIIRRLKSITLSFGDAQVYFPRYATGDCGSWTDGR